MRIKNKVLFNRFKNFVLSIKKQDRVAVIHHTDPDGVCSAVIISKLIQRLRKKKIDLRHNQKGPEHNFTEKTIKLLKKNKINKVITTDMTVDEGGKKPIKKIEKFADILILDHHKIYHDLNSKKTVMLKPQLVAHTKLDSSRYPAAKFVYDLCNKILDIQDLDWVAAAGLIGDASTKSWKPFITKVFKKYKIKHNKDQYKTRLGKVAVVISSAETYSYKNVKLCFDVVYKAKKYQDVLNSKLKRFRKVIDKELNYWIKNVWNFAEVYKDLGLIMYFIKPKYNVKSPLCTLLSLKYPHKIFLIISSNKGITRISARRNDLKFPVNILLRDAIKNFKNCSAGGHIPSAGANIMTKDFKKFKKNIINLLKNGKKS